MRPLLPILIPLLLATAGCLGAEDAALPADAAPADGAAPAATVVAGADEPLNASAPAANREVPISWDGRIGRSFCAPAGPNSCMGTSIGESDTFLPIEEAGALSLDLVASWEAETALTETLVLSVYALTSCGENCYEGEPLGSAEGGSPLALSLDGLALPEGAFLGVSVSSGSDCHGAAVVFGCASVVEQAFHVEGVLVAA